MGRGLSTAQEFNRFFFTNEVVFVVAVFAYWVELTKGN